MLDLSKLSTPLSINSSASYNNNVSTINNSTNSSQNITNQIITSKNIAIFEFIIFIIITLFYVFCCIISLFIII